MELDYSFFGFSPKPSVHRKLKGAGRKSSKLQLMTAATSKTRRAVKPNSTHIEKPSSLHTTVRSNTIKFCSPLPPTAIPTTNNMSENTSCKTSIADLVIVLDSDDDDDHDHTPSRRYNSNALQTIVIESSDEDVDSSLPTFNIQTGLKLPLDRHSDNSSKSGKMNVKVRGTSKVVVSESSSEDSIKKEEVLITHVKSQLTETAQKNIQQWLASSAKMNEAKLSGKDKADIKVSTCPKTKSYEVLNELYGSQWQSARKYIQSDSSSSDNFDNFLKKRETSAKRKIEESPVNAMKCEDFINDGDVSENSIEFYQAILTSENGPIVQRDTKNVMIAARRLSFLHLEDSDNDNEDGISFDLASGSSPLCKRTVVEKESVVKPDNIFALPKSITQPKRKVGKENIHGNISTTTRSFMESLSAITPAPFCDPEAYNFKRNFKKNKEMLAYELFKIFNGKVFKKLLPNDLKIDWNVRLLKTAGYCYNKHLKGTNGEKVRLSRIELSTKVCDTAERLRDTLIHELCHAAVWIVNGVNSGHGAEWKAWTAKANKLYPELPTIKRCHSYNIESKFTYRCTSCGYAIGRQSRSIDIAAKRCGYCYGIFELINNSTKKKDGTAKAPRTPNGFALFIKENYSTLKSSTSLKHADLMKLLGQQFSAQKSSI